MADPAQLAAALNAKPKALQPLYNTLSADPNADYGTLLPVARDKTTGERRVAMPEMVRDGLRGVLDLMAGTETGDVTPEAVQSLVFGGLGAGGALAPRNALAAGGAPIRAYHGSPHNFDRFDASKIGTGEGAQSFGHGMYFAGKEGVAEGYRRKLAGNNGLSPHDLMTDILQSHKGDYAASAAELRQRIADVQQMPPQFRADLSKTNLPEAIRLLEERAAPKGRMYEVGIHEDPAKMLNWDAPLAAQPKPALELGRELGIGSDFAGTPVGRDLYKRLSQSTMEVGNPMDSSSRLAAALLERGVPGVRYLDGMSRIPGQGTSNYVMFPGTEDRIQILRKYGMMAPAPLASPNTVSTGIDTRPRAVFQRILNDQAVK